MSRPFSALALAFGLLAGPAFAAGTLHLEPGQWEFETTSQLPMMPEPRTTKSSNCIQENDADPLEQMTRDARCSISNRQQTGDTLRWEMECPGGAPGQGMKGKGEVTSAGPSAQGKIEMTMSMQGQTMRMSSTWRGKRTGPCQAP